MFGWPNENAGTEHWSEEERIMCTKTLTTGTFYPTLWLKMIAAQRPRTVEEVEEVGGPSENIMKEYKVRRTDSKDRRFVYQQERARWRPKIPTDTDSTSHFPATNNLASNVE